MKLTSIFIISFFLLIHISSAQDSVQVITTWIQQNAIPIKHVEAGNGFSDLQPLKQILKNVKVVGLGEATHGTREFFQFKHRIFDFLVKEMGFTVFTLEASYSACLPINDYVMYGKGDLASALTGQGYSPWDTEEFTELIRWMRSYNKTAPENKKLKFYGLDVPYNQLGREKIISYLQKHAPEKVPATEALFQKLAKGDEKWPMWQDESKSEGLQLLTTLQDLTHYLATHQASLVQVSSPEEFKQIMFHVELMEQMLETFNNNSSRAEFMAKNLLYLMEMMPEAKFVVSAHNLHINNESLNGDPNIGSLLKARLGEMFYSIGFETNEGSYQTRDWLPEHLSVDDFKEVKLAAAPKNSLPWYLSKSKLGDLFLDLREPGKDPLVNHWLSNPQKIREVWWINRDNPSEFFKEVNLTEYFDGIFFIEKSTRARPTKNALVKASNKEGF